MSNSYSPHSKMGTRLREIRQTFGESQTVFAVRFGLKRHDIANYERGRSDLPSSVMGLLDRLGYNITWLVTGEGHMRKIEDLISRFKSLFKEVDRLSEQGQSARTEILKTLAVAEPVRYELENSDQNVTDSQDPPA